MQWAAIMKTKRDLMESIEKKNLPVSTWRFDIIDPPHLNETSPNLLLYPISAIHGHLKNHLINIRPWAWEDKFMNQRSGLTLLQERKNIITLGNSQVKANFSSYQWTWDLQHSFTFLSWNTTNNAIMRNLGNSTAVWR